jgi:transaldolase
MSQSQHAAPALGLAVFADGARESEMVARYKEGFVRGFTTNPTLMRKAGVTDYAGFARGVLSVIKTLPISFEVFSDEFPEMERQAELIASWGANVNVKIPITNTRGESSIPLIASLLAKGIKLNVTAIMTRDQTEALRAVLRPQDDVIVSVFAGRVADTGVDPVPLMTRVVQDYRALPGAKVLWASPREALNIYQADACGCHIITATDDLIDKLLKLRGKSLEEFSLDTVKMFRGDATKAGFAL